MVRGRPLQPKTAYPPVGGPGRGAPISSAGPILARGAPASTWQPPPLDPKLDATPATSLRILIQRGTSSTARFTTSRMVVWPVGAAEMDRVRMAVTIVRRRVPFRFALCLAEDRHAYLVSISVRESLARMAAGHANLACRASGMGERAATD